MPERGNAEHVERVVFVVPDRRHINVAKLVDQFRHCITVADDEHAAAFVVVHDPRDQAFRICCRHDYGLLPESLSQRGRRLLRPSSVANVNCIDSPYPLSTTKHLSETLSPLLTLG